MSAEKVPTPVVEVVGESVPVSSPAPPPVVVEAEEKNSLADDDTWLSRHEWEMLLQSCSAEKTGFISARQLWEKLGHIKTMALKQKLDKEREARNWKRRNNVQPVNPKREIYERQKRAKLAKKKSK